MNVRKLAIRSMEPPPSGAKERNSASMADGPISFNIDNTGASAKNQLHTTVKLTEFAITIFSVCVCVRVCVCTNIHTHTHTYIYTHTHTHTQTHNNISL